MAETSSAAGPIRRYAGAAIMVLGLAVVLAFGGLAVMVTANYVEWANAADALQTISMLTGVPILGGLIMTGLGRLLYGGVRTGRPLLSALPWLMRGLGGALAVVMIGLLANVFIKGAGAEDAWSLARIGMGAAASILLLALARRAGPAPRSA